MHVLRSASADVLDGLAGGVDAEARGEGEPSERGVRRHGPCIELGFPERWTRAQRRAKRRRLDAEDRQWDRERERLALRSIGFERRGPATIPAVAYAAYNALVDTALYAAGLRNEYGISRERNW